MTIKNPIRIGGAVVMAALVVAALVAATAPGAVARHGEDHPVVPGGQASNNCTAEFDLSFDNERSESLSLTDTEDTWETDVPDRPSTVQVDVTINQGGDLNVSVYKMSDGDCEAIKENVSVGSGPEVEGISDDQTIWSHVNLDDTSADYSIIVEDD